MTAGVTIPASAQWTLPYGLEAAAAARHCTRGWLTALVPGAEDVIADACLAASELAGNAAEHGSPPVTLSLSAERRGDEARVTAVVHDASLRMPRVFDANPGDERHRGIFLVEALADSWGMREAADGGKDVWFEVTLAPGAGPRVPVPCQSGSLPERTVAAAVRHVPAAAGAHPVWPTDVTWSAPPATTAHGVTGGDSR